MVEIKDHFLYIDGKKVDYKESPNHGGVISPRYLIMHYTGADTASSAINWLTSKGSKVSAHLHIDREGKVVQMVPFNIKAWHAGESYWKGVINLNSHSIGIELQNLGKEEYTKVQLDSAESVSRALVVEYGLLDVLGHSDIAPARKIDPGKQFPMEAFRAAVMGFVCLHKEVATNLNLRAGNGTGFAVLQVLPKGTLVDVISEAQEWSKVRVNDILTGWVASKYLK